MNYAVGEYVKCFNWGTVLDIIRQKVSSDNPKQRLPSTGIETLSKKTISNRIRRDPKRKKIIDDAKKKRVK